LVEARYLKNPGGWFEAALSRKKGGSVYTMGEKLKKDGGKKEKRRVKYAQVHSVNVRAEYLLFMVVLLTVCFEGL